MKNFVFLLVICFTVTRSYGQKVKSSCNAHDSIKAKYRSDADRLALRRVFKSVSQYNDIPYIPKDWSDSILTALLTVYNLDSIPARDTVISMLKIHTLEEPVLNRFYLAADSNASWMRSLNDSIMPTENDTVDALFTEFKLKLLRYYVVKTQPYHIAVLESAGNFNFEVISNLFDSIGGVYYANSYHYTGDGNDIQATFDSTFIDLIYSFGWGNCIVDCDHRRFWKFRAYYDCSVEYLGSYGNILSTNAVNDLFNKKLKISPNPFTNEIRVEGIQSDILFQIYNTLGKCIVQNKTDKSLISNLEGLPGGLYFLRLGSGENTATFKLIKE